MNDRFKFRGRRSCGEWVYGGLHYNGSTDLCITTDEGMCYIIERDTEEQCTGLKDKNGRLIYEGDIVLYECCFHRYESAVDCFGVEPHLEFDCGESYIRRYTGEVKILPSKGVVIKYNFIIEELEGAGPGEGTDIINNRGYKRIPCANERCEVIGNIHENTELLNNER